MEKRNGLRGVDWAVTAVCAALALLTLGAIGERGRGRAKEAVCQANLHQWHAIFQDYIEENDGVFFTGVTLNGFWWPAQLSQEYQDWKRNRAWFCPVATLPLMDEQGVQYPASAAWGIFRTSEKMTYMGRTYDMSPNGLAGSYALNGYLIRISENWGQKPNRYEVGVPATDGWGDLHDVPDAGTVPMFLDALRFDLWTRHTDAPASSEQAMWSGINHMTKCCINRHDGAVNSLFVDGSVRKVGLKELWTLKWHPSFETRGPWTKAGGVLPTDWPEWLRPFKEY